MKKILIITPHCVLGGAEMVLLSYLQGLVKTNNNVKMIITNNKGELYQRFVDLGIEILDLSIQDINTKIKIMQNEMIASDFVFISNDSLALQLQYILKNQGAKFKVFTILHSTFHYYVNLIKKHFETIDKLIIIHEKIKDALSDLDQSKILLIRNGIDLDYFERKQSKQQSKQSLGFSEDTKILLYVGRISSEKNVLSIVKGFKRLRENNKKLIIVGNASESQVKTLQTVTDEASECSDIIFVGYTEDVRVYYEAADLNIIASFDEGLPITLLEASAMDVPTFATTVGDIKNFIEDKSYLFELSGKYNQLKADESFDEKDMKVFIKRIERLLVQDNKDQIKRMKNKVNKLYNNQEQQQQSTDLFE